MKDYILTLLSSYLDGHTKQQKVIIWTGNGCHAKGTKIMMADGSSKNVEDIKVGDKLMGDDSTPRLVKRLCRNKGQMYKVIPIKGKPYIVNEDHVLCLKATSIGGISFNEKEKRWKLLWQERDENGYPKACCKNFPIRYDGKQLYKKSVTYYDTREDAKREADKYRDELRKQDQVIKKGDIFDIKLKDYLKIKDKIGVRNYNGFKASVEFKNKKLDLDPYILGYWLGDGHSYSTAFTTDDQEIVEYFEEYFKKFNLNVIKYKHQHYNVTNKNVWGLGSNHFLNILKEYDLLQNKHVPSDFKFNSREKRLRLLAGLIDSDGHYQKASRQYEFNMKSEKLIDDIIYLARSLGFGAYKKKCTKTCTNAPGGPKEGTYYRTQIFGKGLEDIPSILVRKQVLERKCKKDATLTGLKFEKLTIDDYYGFELDGNHRYLMDDFTVTHNSNGKSVCINFFQAAFGAYCGVLPITVLTRKQGGAGNATPELADTWGKRFVVFQEPENDDKLYIGRMKELSGSDWIYARKLFRDPIKFKPQFKLVLTCNKLPHIDSTDGGTWRRLRVTPWESEFVDLDKNGLCYGKKLKAKQFPKDYDINEKCEKWKRVFMWYLIKEYYPKYKTDGLREPDKVLAFTNKYKKDSDIYLEYLDENLIRSGNKKDYQPIDLIYGAFKFWYRESYANNKCPSKKELREYMENHEYDCRKGYVFGVRFSTDDDIQDELDA
jgi:hypothetical protein